MQGLSDEKQKLLLARKEFKVDKPCADPEEGTGGPDPPEKSQKYRTSK